MKEEFYPYYKPTKSEFDAIWADSYLAVDANVLLNLYKYSKATASELLDLLQRRKERLWLPHQAGPRDADGP